MKVNQLGNYTNYQKNGDFLKVFLPKDRKVVKQGTYTSPVKALISNGCEVLIHNNRVTISSMESIISLHRSDGYSYEYYDLLQNNEI